MQQQRTAEEIRYFPFGAACEVPVSRQTEKQYSQRQAGRCGTAKQVVWQRDWYQSKRPRPEKREGRVEG